MGLQKGSSTDLYPSPQRTHILGLLGPKTRLYAAFGFLMLRVIRIYRKGSEYSKGSLEGFEGFRAWASRLCPSADLGSRASQDFCKFGFRVFLGC